MTSMRGMKNTFGQFHLLRRLTDGSKKVRAIAYPACLWSNPEPSAILKCANCMMDDMQLIQITSKSGPRGSYACQSFQYDCIAR